MWPYPADGPQRCCPAPWRSAELRPRWTSRQDTPGSTQVTRVVAASTAAGLDGPAFDRCSPSIGDPALPSGGEFHQLHIGLGFLLETNLQLSTCPQPWSFGTNFTDLHEPNTSVKRV